MGKFTILGLLELLKIREVRKMNVSKSAEKQVTGEGPKANPKKKKKNTSQKEARRKNRRKKRKKR